jgi:acyl-[acyl-carrier-protein]-phospholipid O-acyltransferase/long-chain-fatty-acid--[acyl-carrier-protein] ligase
MTPDRVVLIFGILTLVCSVYILALVPEFLIRFSLWLFHAHHLSHPHSKASSTCRSADPPCWCNHLSHVDGLWSARACSASFRFLVYRALLRTLGLPSASEADEGDSDRAGRDALATLETAPQPELEQGHVVASLAEGAISRTGNMLPFKRGFERNRRRPRRADHPRLPRSRLGQHLQLQGAGVFSGSGRFACRIRWNVAFGAPMPSTTTAAEARLALMTLGGGRTEATAGQRVLGRQFIRRAAQLVLVLHGRLDGQTLYVRPRLVASLLLSRWIRRRCRREHVGLLLPASVGGSLANVAMTLAGKVPVNLNFTAGKDAMAPRSSVRHQDDRHVAQISSRRARLAPSRGMVFLEDT